MRVKSYDSADISKGDIALMMEYATLPPLRAK